MQPLFLLLLFPIAAKALLLQQAPAHWRGTSARLRAKRGGGGEERQQQQQNQKQQGKEDFFSLLLNSSAFFEDFSRGLELAVTATAASSLPSIVKDALAAIKINGTSWTDSGSEIAGRGTPAAFPSGLLLEEALAFLTKAYFGYIPPADPAASNASSRLASLVSARLDRLNYHLTHCMVSYNCRTDLLCTIPDDFLLELPPADSAYVDAAAFDDFVGGVGLAALFGRKNGEPQRSSPPAMRQKQLLRFAQVAVGVKPLRRRHRFRRKFREIVYLMLGPFRALRSTLFTRSKREGGREDDPPPLRPLSSSLSSSVADFSPLWRDSMSVIERASSLGNKFKVNHALMLHTALMLSLSCYNLQLDIPVSGFLPPWTELGAEPGDTSHRIELFARKALGEHASRGATTRTIISDKACAVVVVAPEINATFIAFRGTKELSDVMSDINFVASRFRSRNGAGGSDMLVHRGFLEAFQSVLQQISAVVDRSSSSNIFFTGHSMGGALATISAAYFADRNPFLISLSAPAIGNEPFCSHVTRFAHPYGGFRIWNERDPVPLVAQLVGFKHAGVPLPRRLSPEAVKLFQKAVDLPPASAAALAPHVLFEVGSAAYVFLVLGTKISPVLRPD
jgi:hypothetical protein